MHRPVPSFSVLRRAALWQRLVLLLATSLLLAACGFQLRGAITLPYKTFFVALPETSEIGANLKRYLRASESTELVETPGEAEAILVQTSEMRQKLIVSVNTSGLVREYQLRLTYTFRVVSPKGEELVANNQVMLTRDLTYNDDNILSKTEEEALLWRDMQNDLVQQILRRISILKPKTQLPETDPED